MALVVLALGAAFWNVWRHIDRELEQGWLPLSVLPIVMLIVVGALVAVYVPWTARRAYRRGKLIRDPADVEWNERSLTIRTTALQSSIPWEDYVKWKENDRLFLLYFSDTLFQVLPKRIFGSRREQDTFRDHLSRVGTKSGNA